MNKLAFGELPEMECSAHEIEIRPRAARWARWEGRVVVRRRWVGSDDWATDHVYPARPNPPGARTIRVGGWPYWMRSRSKDRLERKLRAWIAGEIRARQQAEEIEVIKP